LDINSIPAIPILGAIPTAKHPLLLLTLLLPILVIALNQFKIFHKFSEFRLRQKEVLVTVFPLILLLVLFSYFAGGTLLTQDMKPVGIAWWKLPAIFGAIQLMTLVFGLYIPKLVNEIKARKSEI
jgi:hypothetical protein